MIDVIINGIKYDVEGLEKIIEKNRPQHVIFECSRNANIKPLTDLAFCPICGQKHEYNSKEWECNFCRHCGQRLDWGEFEK